MIGSCKYLFIYIFFILILFTTYLHVITIYNNNKIFLFNVRSNPYRQIFRRAFRVDFHLIVYIFDWVNASIIEDNFVFLLKTIKYIFLFQRQNILRFFKLFLDNYCISQFQLSEYFFHKQLSTDQNSLVRNSTFHFLNSKLKLHLLHLIIDILSDILFEFISLGSQTVTVDPPQRLIPVGHEALFKILKRKLRDQLMLQRIAVIIATWIPKYHFGMVLVYFFIFQGNLTGYFFRIKIYFIPSFKQLQCSHISIDSRSNHTNFLDFAGILLHSNYFACQIRASIRNAKLCFSLPIIVENLFPIITLLLKPETSFSIDITMLILGSSIFEPQNWQSDLFFTYIHLKQKYSSL